MKIVYYIIFRDVIDKAELSLSILIWVLIPRFLQQSQKNEPIAEYGDGKQKRWFCESHENMETILFWKFR